MKHLLSVCMLVLMLCLSGYAQDTWKEQPDTVRQDTVSILYKAGLEYEQAGDKKKALAVYEKALGYLEKFSEPYGAMLEKLAFEYCELNDEQQFMYYMGLIDEYNKHELEKDCHEPGCMLERAEYHAVMNDLAEAKKCYLEAILMSRTPEEKTVSQSGYAEFLFINRNYEEAKEYLGSLCMDYERRQVKDEAYVTILRNLAYSDYYLGDFGAAVSGFRKYRAVYDEIGMERSGMYYTSLSVMASACFLKKDYQDALDIYEEVRDYYSSDKECEGYADALRNIAGVYVKLEHYQEAVSLYKESIDIYEKSGNGVKMNQAMSDLNICCIEANIPFDESIVEEQGRKMIQYLLEEDLKNLSVNERLLGDDDLMYVQTLGDIAMQYQILGDYDNAVDFYSRYVPAERKAIKAAFRTLDVTNRELVWKEYSDALDSLMNMVLLPAGANAGTVAALAYDAQLLSKGILLNSAIEFEKVVQSTGDMELKAVYEQIKENAERISAIRESGGRMDSLLVLKRTNDALEMTLLERCAEYKDYTDYLSYTWKDVRERLEKNDVAIEFAEVKNGLLDGDNMIVALLITRDCDWPSVIPVCSRRLLQQAMGQVGVYDCPEAGALVWNRIIPYLEGRKRLFFSADAELNAFAIEYLPVSGVPIFERYDIYRLSSTKELCKESVSLGKRKVALWGGVDYTQEPTSNVPEIDAAKNLFALQEDSVKRSFDGAFDFNLLAYSLEEVRKIRDLLSGVQTFDIVQYVVGTNAGKSNFLNLDSLDVNVLHLSTHGVYQEPGRKEDTDPMNLSFLVLAGANTLFVDPADAVVTATEIARMNFRDCELAVLSACESGLGKLDKDGVFGLQRGFKNAGVHSLMMSLKSIYDKQSADMMVLFYDHWIKEGSKHKAFVQTLQELRKKGWASEHWASFIMLDALE